MCHSHNIPLGELLERCCREEEKKHEGVIRQMPTVTTSFGGNHAVVTIRFTDLSETTEFDFVETPARPDLTPKVHAGLPS